MAIYVDMFGGMTNGTPSDIRRLVSELIATEGIFNSYDVDSFKVAAQSTPDMTVKVNPGSAVVKNDSYTNHSSSDQFWHVHMDAVQNVTIAANSSGNPRVDIIILTVNSGASANADASNVASVTVVAGTPAASPSAPSVPNNSVLLAQVAVSNGATSINSGNITDRRFEAGLSVADAGGWQGAAEAWTYASATTFTISGDYRHIYAKGDKIRLVQSNTTKYFYITNVAFAGSTTTVTITGGSDYSLANSAITFRYYSKATNPNGFPDWFNWTPTYGGTASMTYTGVTLTRARFRVIGKQVFFNLYTTGTTGGTASYAIYATAPIATSESTFGGGGLVRVAGTFMSGTFEVATNQIQASKYDRSNWALGANSSIIFSGAYEY